MLDTVQAYVGRHQLLSRGDQVLVAVSGGADSVAMLAVLRRLASTWDLGLRVAHLNHRLRPGADEDARFVADLASAWGLPAEIEAVDVPAHARERRLSPEAAAREVRYAFLGRVAEATGCGRVAVGHTADDQAETVLLRLMRGRPGGMRAERALGSARLIRPLLDVWRAEARAYLREESIPWREDPSNEDRRFLRNRLRHDLIPILEGHMPDVRRRLKQAGEVLAAEDEVLEQAALAVEEEALIQEPDGISLRRTVLNRASQAVRRRVLRRAVGRAGGSISRLKFVHIEWMVRLAGEGDEGTEVDLPGVRAQARGDLIVLTPRLGEMAASSAVRSLQRVSPSGNGESRR